MCRPINEPTGGKPKSWLSFLNSIFGNDAESIKALQEFMGSVLDAEE
ncbi:hypothetical protein KIH39_04680 [Telmatocola sphagniphila]|uniref:Uncharacterized protein n=1 Tax=Telmatocola sphagniphila TaxID=1123043 RepID=A0A8E6B8R5_9BACT|nr:hypothetical protein [Telmatocola sphagniphila]QVL33216.1 hypothetical protein KIH39_04680 [Telmatocola sphagniphila]